MPVKPLSDTQELVELTVFHSLRQTVVDNGLCPDIMNYPNTEQGSNDYWTAYRNITNAKGFSIEVFNNSNPEHKGVKKLPRIVLISESFLPGEIGGDGSRYYKPDPQNGFKVLIRPPQTVDFYFKVHLCCENSKQYRICLGIMANAIPTRGYLDIFQPFNNYLPSKLFIENVGVLPTPFIADGVMEYVYRYVIRDMWLEEFSQDLGTVAPLEDILMKFNHASQTLESFHVS